MKKFAIILLVSISFTGLFTGCKNDSDLLHDINNKQNDIIQLLEYIKEEGLSQTELEESKLALIKLKDELKALEERYNK